MKHKEGFAFTKGSQDIMVTVTRHVCLTVLTTGKWKK
jgi:hypothetical protein